jgi:hypothetical protein
MEIMNMSFDIIDSVYGNISISSDQDDSCVEISQYHWDENRNFVIRLDKNKLQQLATVIETILKNQ